MVSQSNNDSLLSVDQVTKQYRRGNRDIPVLRNISCQISQGDFVFIVGPSGSGKSTLLYLMGGLDQPSSGEISIASQSLSKMSPKSLDQLR
ncbi:MAG: ATP-binding cassette domain-containing protein, partial [Planctomicrobium sp.]|nr:ATP-binding cassette domain-containing protein [Planctomicrobium sp.]